MVKAEIAHGSDLVRRMIAPALAHKPVDPDVFGPAALGQGHPLLAVAAFGFGALLAETGMRVGQALGLRHSDFVSHRREVHIVPRADNANRARAKVRSSSVVPVSVSLVRLYSDYMHTEYGDIDSDYVFVNLFAGKVGRPMSYPAVHELIGRVGARSGVSFTAHMMRHSAATDMVRQGVPVEIVARLLTHRSSTTTCQTYVHLEAADIKEALLRGGVWAAAEDEP